MFFFENSKNLLWFPVCIFLRLAHNQIVGPPLQISCESRAPIGQNLPHRWVLLALVVWRRLWALRIVRVQAVPRLVTVGDSRLEINSFV